MKIAVVTYVLNTHSGARSGIEIAQVLAKNHSVALFYTPTLFDPILHTSLSRQKNLILAQVTSLLDLYSKLMSFRPDLISFHGTPLQLLPCRLSGIPIFSHYYGSQFNPISEYFTPPNDYSKLMDKFSNISVYLATLLLIWLPQHLYGISRYTSWEALHLFGRSTQPIHLGVSNLPHGKKILHRGINLLSISRITPYKQFEKLIAIVNSLNLPRVTLTIIGSAPKPQYLSYLQTLTSPKVKLLLDIPDSQLAHFYRQCDIYVTADKYLFFGLPVLEAASYAVPSIAFSYAAASEVVLHGQTGFVVRTPAQFSKYLRTLILSKPLRTHLGHQAKLHSQDFSWANTIAQLEHEYHTYAH